MFLLERTRSLSAIVGSFVGLTPELPITYAIRSQKMELLYDLELYTLTNILT